MMASSALFDGGEGMTLAVMDGGSGVELALLFHFLMGCVPLRSLVWRAMVHKKRSRLRA